MYVAKRRVRLNGKWYEPGERVPDKLQNRLALESTGRIAKVADPAPEPEPVVADEPADDAPSLDWTRAALDAYAADHGVDTAALPNKAAVLAAIDALAGEDGDA